MSAFEVDATDLFCGGGGSTYGLSLVPGLGVAMAANHWPMAVATHQRNHPNTEHDCADISQVDPRRYRRTRMLWASPDCTWQTKASGRKRDLNAYSDGKTLPTDPAERSRATMWDVVRFTEYHRYEAVIVENVVEVVGWPPFRAWVMAMESLGYQGETVWMSSAHASAGGPAAGTMRNRYYSAWTRQGATRPDLAKWTSPAGTCGQCGVRGRLVKWWKKGHDRDGGVYGASRQYLFRCSACSSLVRPDHISAASSINWLDTGRGVLDRANTDLAPNTLRKISEGLPRHAVDGMAMPFIVEMRGGGSHSRAISDPMSTITAKGNHHGLLTPPGYDPITGTGSVPLDQLRLADCTYRMVSPFERQLISAFPASYELLGVGSDHVRMIGNAVNPPAARVLGAAVFEALTGSVNLSAETPLELAA
jgi:DNA (cytosine-5)-methyltransferase 1